MNRLLLAFGTLLTAIAPSFVQAADDTSFAIKDGDRVVFYGDSITDQRLYTTFAETFIVTRFPGWKVDFTHSGWGGDRVGGGGGGPIDLRLERDVFPYKPTVMTIMLGMNDASYRAFDQKIFDTYANGYRHIIEKLKANLPGLRLTLIVPSPFDDVTRPANFEGGYNAVLLRYGQFLKELAGSSGASVADLNTSVVEATKKAKEIDAKLSEKLNPDRVHPSPAGQLLMAAALLRDWHAPALVSSVDIDLTKAMIHAEKTAATDLKVVDNGVSWTQLDQALPFPVNMKDEATKLALKSSSFVQDLNRQPLKVNGLKADNYQLKIDGKVVGDFSKADLAKGINLAEFPTPMLDQAFAVHALTLEHNNVHFDRWRHWQVPYKGRVTDESLAKVMEALDSVEAQLVAKQRETATPKPRRFELIAK